MRPILLILLFLTPWLVGCGGASLESEQQANRETPELSETKTSVSTSVATAAEPMPVPVGQQVAIVVEGPSGRKVQVISDVASDTSLEAVMRQADELNVVLTGSGTTAFVHQIGDVQTGLREGWTYKVDGDFAKVGIGQFLLKPPALVQWTYGKMEQD